MLCNNWSEILFAVGKVHPCNLNVKYTKSIQLGRRTGLGTLNQILVGETTIHIQCVHDKLYVMRMILYHVYLIVIHI